MPAVEIQNVVDDRQDTSEGVYPVMTNREHPVTAGIPWEEVPMFFGYNKTNTREESTLLGNVEGYPFLAVRELENSRVLTFTSDPCEHWGGPFTCWEFYPQFWSQAVHWVAEA